MSIPLAAVALSGLLFAGRAYEAKLAARREASAHTFQAALDGCPPSPPRAGVVPDEEAGQVAVAGADLSALDRHVPGAPNSGVKNFRYGSTGGRVQKVERADALLGGFDVGVSASVAAPCNEHAHDGDVKKVRSIAAGSFNPLFP
ncbi:MAG: hypothetical protein JNL38_19855 [Myxococcales bacterium]|nr:hypothetical protein [Myxococcales bacterium]